MTDRDIIDTFIAFDPANFSGRLEDLLAAMDGINLSDDGIFLNALDAGWYLRTSEAWNWMLEQNAIAKPVENDLLAYLQQNDPVTHSLIVGQLAGIQASINTIVENSDPNLQDFFFASWNQFWVSFTGVFGTIYSAIEASANGVTELMTNAGKLLANSGNSQSLKIQILDVMLEYNIPIGAGQQIVDDVMTVVEALQTVAAEFPTLLENRTASDWAASTNTILQAFYDAEVAVNDLADFIELAESSPLIDKLNAIIQPFRLLYGNLNDYNALAQAYASGEFTDASERFLKDAMLATRFDLAETLSATLDAFSEFLPATGVAATLASFFSGGVQTIGNILSEGQLTNWHLAAREMAVLGAILAHFLPSNDL